MTQNRVLSWIDSAHETVTQAFNRSSALLAPAPSAIALYMAMVESFGMVASVILAFVVEGLGFATVDFLLRAWSRQTRRAIQISAVVFAGVYLGTVFALLALIPDGEEWANVARAFPFLTIVGAGVVGGNRVMDEEDAEPYEQERQAIELQHLKLSLRDERRRVASVPVSVPGGTGQPSVSSGGSVPPDDKAAAVAAYFRDNPSASLRQAASDLGMGKSTVSRYKSQQEHDA